MIPRNDMRVAMQKYDCKYVKEQGFVPYKCRGKECKEIPDTCTTQPVQNVEKEVTTQPETT